LAGDPASFSENVPVTRLTLPSWSVSSIWSAVRPGAALSVGVTVVKDAALLPAASTTPPEPGAVELTGNEPTVVSADPAPSLSDSVTTAPFRLTLASDPALGTFASVQG